MCVSCRVQFFEYIKNNIHLYCFRNGIILSIACITNFSTGELVSTLIKLNLWALMREKICIIQYKIFTKITTSIYLCLFRKQKIFYWFYIIFLNSIGFFHNKKYLWAFITTFCLTIIDRWFKWMFFLFYIWAARYP
jgi:hypothetical protein